MAAPPDEPCARGTLFVAAREAALDLWGAAGLALIGERLPVDARRDTIDAIITPTHWLPERHLLAWYEAVWAGPGNKTDEAVRRFVDRRMDFGFGRVRRMLLGLVTPIKLAARASELWRYDHTHGTLSYTAAAELHEMEMVLTDHPYASTRLGRIGTAEVYRYAGALSHAKNVEENHFLDENGALHVKIKWK